MQHPASPIHGPIRKASSCTAPVTPKHIPVYRFNAAWCAIRPFPARARVAWRTQPAIVGPGKAKQRRPWRPPGRPARRGRRSPPQAPPQPCAPSGSDIARTAPSGAAKTAHFHRQSCTSGLQQRFLVYPQGQQRPAAMVDGESFYCRMLRPDADDFGHFREQVHADQRLDIHAHRAGSADCQRNPVAGMAQACVYRSSPTPVSRPNRATTARPSDPYRRCAPTGGDAAHKQWSGLHGHPACACAACAGSRSR